MNLEIHFRKNDSNLKMFEDNDGKNIGKEHMEVR